MRSSNLTKTITIALMGAISMVLMLLNFPLPMLPAYLKIDFSEVPVLLAALLFSPMAGVAVEAIKNLLYLIFTGAGDPVGVVANFLAGMMFVLPVAYFYHTFKASKRTLVSGLATGTVVMAIGMGLLNYFVVLPLYIMFAGYPSMSPEAKWLAVTAGIVPFNLIKGIIIAIVFVPLFAKLKPWFAKRKRSGSAAA
ncbi:ECF transporter S component [Terribacillus sp. DMT04]|uniref:ECF transporter S component n=1 Tax=Terribacillus sp. DMT04 TaxID=2850441 RepID=UPI001C2C1B81|nr:ECF transporter S component [Terribacillus sp. DMT04]QXE00771.1 ECF transporter S component [Terribacillus sp. DMT04]